MAPRRNNKATKATTAALAIAFSMMATTVRAVDVVKCTNAAFSDTFCPYGYTSAMVATGSPLITADPPTAELCCARDTTTASFPVCASTTAGGADAVQAVTSDDTNWAVQDNSGFARSVGQFTGMCFSVVINNDCSAGNPLLASKCCAKKAPSYLQFKLPESDLGITALRASTLTSTNVKKCKLSYGTAGGSAASLKRITKWTPIGTGVADSAEYFNVPITWRKGQKQATVCVYSNYFNNDSDIDCSWENLCGFADGSVPTDAGVFAKGCELRIVGRKGAATSACCAPTFSVQAFDSNDEARLSAAAAAGPTTSIELLGH